MEFMFLMVSLVNNPWFLLLLAIVGWAVLTFFFAVITAKLNEKEKDSHPGKKADLYESAIDWLSIF